MTSMAASDAIKKNNRSKKMNRTDPERFKPPGMDFRGKLIGVEDVPEARGDKMCQVAMAKLKAAVRTIGDHKQRIIVNVSLEGIKITDEKTEEVIHRHIVQRISFIARDVSDTRAFGYIYGVDGKHQFFGIKTEKVAEGIVLSLRDLFQIVFEMKKREIDAVRHSYQLDGNVLMANSRLSRPNSLSTASNENGDERGSLPSDSLSNLELGEHDSIQEGLDQIYCFVPPPTSTSPGGNSWPMASSLWGETTPPAYEDKYNTLPAGSAALYRSLFASGSKTTSRSPLSMRSSSVRLEQHPKASIESDVAANDAVSNSTTTTPGAVPLAFRPRNRSLSQRSSGTESSSETCSLPPPVGVASSRRLVGHASPSSAVVAVPAASAETPAPVTETGWAKFDLSPLAENATDVPQVAGTQSLQSDAPFAGDTFVAESSAVGGSDGGGGQPRKTTTTPQGFACFPSPDAFTDTGQSGRSDNNDQSKTDDMFADSFVANSLSFDDSLQHVDGIDGAISSTALDLMSPSSDRDSLSLPSPDAPPPPLPAGLVITLPSEPPVPPPRPRTKSNHVLQPVPEAPFGNVEMSGSELQSSTPQSLDKPGQNLFQSDPFFTSNSHNGGSKPFEFPPEDTAPPRPPRHVPDLNFRSLPRPNFSRGMSMPCAPVPATCTSPPVTGTAPPPPPRRVGHVKSITGSTDDPFAPFPPKITNSSRPVPVVQNSVDGPSPHLVRDGVVRDVSVVETTTVTPLPHPAAQLHSSPGLASLGRNPISLPAAVAAVAAAEISGSTSSSPWMNAESESVDGFEEPSAADPFVDVDPFAISATVPDDPFAETITDLARDFESSTLTDAPAFHTRAVTIQSVSSDVFESDFVARQNSSGSRSSYHSPSSKTAASTSSLEFHSLAGFGASINSNSSCQVTEPNSAVATTAAAKALQKPPPDSCNDRYSAFDSISQETGSVNWVTFQNSTSAPAVAAGEIWPTQQVISTVKEEFTKPFPDSDVVNVFDGVGQWSRGQMHSQKETSSAQKPLTNLFPVDDPFS